MTVEWSAYAQSLTERPMKGMLTGPVTILQWSFVRDDQPRVGDLPADRARDARRSARSRGAGIRVIQIDEPALREGLPLRRRMADYLDWAVDVLPPRGGGVRGRDADPHPHVLLASSTTSCRRSPRSMPT